MKIKSALTYTLLSICIVLSYSIFFFFNEEVYVQITSEDQLTETIGALLLVASSILFLTVWLRSKKGNDFYFFRTKKNLFFLLLAILFFLGFGEEISWGQRIFNIQTPEVLKEINFKQETNIHNLVIFREGLLDHQHVFTYFWITFCLIIPFLNLKSPAFAKFLNRINMPVVPIWISVFFIIGYFPSIILKFIVPVALLQAVVEVKETILSLLFFVYSLQCLIDNRH